MTVQCVYRSGCPHGHCDEAGYCLASGGPVEAKPAALTSKTVMHAGKMEDSGRALCHPLDHGAKLAKSGDIVNCPDCRVILNHVRRNFNEHYVCTTMTKEQKREAAEAMYRDLVLGEVND